MRNLYNKNIIWGTHASVEVIGNLICNKVYTDYTLFTIKDHVINEWIFNTIKELNLVSFIRLYEYVFDDKKNQIISYTMEYYPPYVKDILRISSEYIVNSFEKIYDDVITLSNAMILIGDMNFSNIIFGKDGIKVIDFDNYKKSNLNIEEIIKLNKNELCMCFKTVYRNALYYEFANGYIPNSLDKNMDLFNPNIDELIFHVKKRVLNYSNLLDYFKYY